MFFLVISAIGVICFLLWFFIFSTYEVRISHEKMDSGDYIVKAIPLNSLGKQVPWKDVRCSYNIDSKNAEVVEADFNKGTIIIKPGNNEEIILSAESEYSLWKNIITIPQNNPGES